MPARDDFAELLDEGLAVDVEAHWGAGFLDGRYLPSRPTWTWPQVTRPYLDDAERLLDMGTGDGSQLRALEPWPACTIAYEEWWPTVPTAAETLRPGGAYLVVCLGSDDNTASVRTRPGLPFADESFDVIVNRHEAFDPNEVRRTLRPGGAFVTQQVGGDEETGLRTLLGLAPQVHADWTLAVARSQMEAAGLRLVDGAEEQVPTRFIDIAAFVAYVRSVPWSVPEFDPAAMRARLEALHEQCRREDGIETVSHRFWVAARLD